MSCRILYITLKILYMSVWFYWGGYTIIFLSYVAPYSADVHMEAKRPGFSEYRNTIEDIRVPYYSFEQFEHEKELE